MNKKMEEKDKKEGIKEFSDEKDVLFKGKNQDELAFFYGISPETIEAKRGHAVLIKYKKTEDMVSGYLWNIDPWSGTVFVFQKRENEMAAMRVVMSDSIFSITFLNDKEPVALDVMDAYINLDKIV
ncbi:hypothetical protein PMAC_001843 [Pneumocystis sp. 'macacae']|nr:hypothetical protein PMAC_001843 [Pneumocystis sp. 'macacae']